MKGRSSWVSIKVVDENNNALLATVSPLPQHPIRTRPPSHSIVPDPAPPHESVLILQSTWIGVEKYDDHSVVTGRGEEEPVGQNGDDKRTSLASSFSS